MMHFGAALNILKHGGTVLRKGWNGMFIYHVAAGLFPAASPVAIAHWGRDGFVPYRPYIAMFTADGQLVPWVASQSDLLADDWEQIMETSVG